MHDKIPEPLSRPVEPTTSGSNVPPVSSAPSATASSTPMGMPASNVGKPSKGKAVLVVLLILILMASTAAFGYLWWQARSAQAQVSQAQSDKAAAEKKLAEAETKAGELEKSSKETAEVPKKTDEESLKQWASDQCALTGKTLEKFTLTLVKGDFAQLTYMCKGENESPNYYLKKANNQWYLVYQGLGPISASDRTKYSIPSGFPSSL